MRVAFFSPLPPARSGIADYSEALLERLKSLADVEAFSSARPDFDPAQFNIALYQLGNNGHHAFVYEMALRHPGVVVMHESNLHHLIADITIRRGDWEAYLRECEYDSGPLAREFAERVRRLKVGPDYEGVPMTRRILETARGVVVHSKHMRERMRAAGFAGPVAVIPHGAWIPQADRTAQRHKLGLDELTPLVGVFGFLKPYKRIAESLRAFRRLARLAPNIKMILVGEPHPDLRLEEMVRSMGLSANVRILGFQPIEEFTGLLAACDIVLNLRYPTVGESSGTLLRALGLGKAVLVSEVGSFAEFSEDICLKVPVGTGEEDLIFEYLNLLVSRPELARELGARAKDYVARECNWAAVARKYAAFLEAVAAGKTCDENGADSCKETCAEEVGQASWPVQTDLEAGLTQHCVFDELGASPASEPDGPSADSFRSRRDVEVGQASSSSPWQDSSNAAHAGKNACATIKPQEFTRSGGAGIQPAGLLSQASELIRTDLEAPLAQDWLFEQPETPSAREADGLVAYLRTWAQDGAARQYLETHETRLAKTLAITPPGSVSDRVLEMGAYLQITPALRTRLGYGEVRGCYYGKTGQTYRRVAVSSEGERFACEIDHFDAERDAFPYAEGYFSTVLCCELIEHLLEDPMHLMCEVNRILKLGGNLVLTTPNVAALRGISAILLGHHPGFFPAYIRPAATGEVEARHNREYTPREVHQLLDNSGFEVARLETGEFRDEPHPEYGWVLHLLERYRLETDWRGDGIYAVGRKTGPVKNRYPDWLYS